MEYILSRVLLSTAISAKSSELKKTRILKGINEMKLLQWRTQKKKPKKQNQKQVIEYCWENNKICKTKNENGSVFSPGHRDLWTLNKVYK